MALRPQHVAQELLTKVTKALGITAVDQWYYVSHHAATRAIGARVLNKHGGSLASFLKSAYPHHEFDEDKLASKKNLEKDQKFVEVIIRQLFPNAEIHTKARKAVGIVNPETNEYLEIDFWIPSLKLGIEFQDKHHFGYQWYANDTLENYQKRDDIKKDAMSRLGYTLITIGYWWDKTIESLAATIRQFRPDILLDYEKVSAEPVPSDPPQDHASASSPIPDVVGLMSPFVPPLKFNPIDWYAGEKHDGTRGVYNPKLHKLFSRSGNELSAHTSCLKDIPNILVEGEIVAGRGNYYKTTALSNHIHQDKVNWPMLRYVIFDIPDADAGNYTERYHKLICGLSERSFIFSQLAFRVLVASKAHLETLMGAIIGDAGEGVIAQQDALYEYGRAKGLAKIKVRRDADAQVLHVNKISCTCKLVSGATAEILFCDDFKPNSIKVGDIVSYYHNGYSLYGLPKKAEIYKVRYDINWNELLTEKEPKKRSVKEALGAGSLFVHNIGRKKLERGHWNNSTNARAFLDEFARTSSFDPLVAENWYSVKVNALRSAGGYGLLNAYNFNVKKVLSHAYPELKFEAGKFIKQQTKVKHGHWAKSVNVRAFFDEFARKGGFDPLDPENWYSVKGEALRNAGGSSILRAFDFSRMKALSCAYPELKFKPKFRTREKPKARIKLKHWDRPSNVREFFDEFAQKNRFDPLKPANWYTVKGVTLRDAGGSGILRVFKFNVKKALSCAYPELNFEDKFRTHEKPQAKTKMGHWHKPANVRLFFDQFASTSGFDPLVVENWYSVRVSTLNKAGGAGVLNAHNHHLSDALSCAYPELTLDKDKFATHAIKGRWNKEVNVRVFFDEFARKTGFDPLVAENWYPVRVYALQNAGGSGIVKAYSHLKEALSYAYPKLRLEAEKFITHRKGQTLMA